MSYVDERQQLIKVLGFFWVSVFLDSDFIDGYTKTVALRLADLKAFSDRLPDYASRQLLAVTEVQENRIFTFDEADLDNNALHFGSGGTYGQGGTYGSQTTALESFVYPFDTSFEPEFLAPFAVVPGTILRKGEDYTFGDNTIIFNEDPLRIPELVKNVQNDSAGQPLFLFFLWGFKLEEDVNAVCDFFGTIAGACTGSTALAKEAMNIAWDLRVTGATIKNTHRLLSLITDADYVSADGVVQEIFYEGNKICALTDNAVYCAPAESLATVVTGEGIQEADIIFDIFEAKYGTDNIDFDEFEGLTLGPGYLTKEIKGELFLPNVLGPLTRGKHPGWYDVVEEEATVSVAESSAESSSVAESSASSSSS